MKMGIVGLPNVGKSTLFNAITNAKAEAANYPFCTIDPNVGAVCVPDARLDALSGLYNPQKVTPAVIEFVDIAGLVKGASKGEGLGNKFLSHIREVDAILHVVRCFADDNIVHVDGKINPASDVETINLELIFSDLDILERRIDRLKKALKGDKKYQGELALCEKIKENLESGRIASRVSYAPEEEELLKNIDLLTLKPILFIANLSEEDFKRDLEANENYLALKEIAKAQNAGIVPICAKIEEEISELSPEDKELFLSEMGLSESGLDRIVKESYALLGLISFLTAGEPEVRAWTIKKGTKAPAAAGKIHSDFERGFIRAEVVSFADLMEHKSLSAAREKGLVRSEGKEYEVKDGDIILFRFNV
jgi:GTP-binding protein YchF